MRIVVIASALEHATNVLERELDDLAVERVDADERPDLAAGARLPLAIAYDGDRPGARVERATRDAIAQLSRGELPRARVATPAPAGDWAALVSAAFDGRYGGFDRPGKPFRGALLELLLARPEERARKMALRTLDGIVAGGTHDQLGGGFHAASTDEAWMVPRFEKRASVQAELLRALVAANDPRFAVAIAGTLDYVATRLALPGGGFALGESADVGPYDDGSYWTWSLDEARAVLDPDELACAQPCFDIYGRGELASDPTRNVLFVAAPIDAIARELGLDVAIVRRRIWSARAKLLAAREQRERPPLDARIFVAENAALCRALIACDHASLARGTLDRLYAEAPSPGGIRRRLGGAPIAWLDDAAQLALAALADGRRDLAERLAPHADLPGSPDGIAATIRVRLALGDEAGAAALLDAQLPHAIAQGLAGAAIVALALEVKKLHLTF